MNYRVRECAMRRRCGQVALYMLLSLVAIFLFALLAVDVFLSVRTKNRLQNGGDAAALAVARRQGELINEIGRLNLEHLKAVIEDDKKTCAEIELAQRRLALLEPVYALKLADQAAKRNKMPENEAFTKLLRDHVHTVLTLYAGGNGESDPYPESYPGAWAEYAAALDSVALGGLSAGADNVEFYTVYGNHLLMNEAFYNAVAGNDWCWFYFNCIGVFNNYSSYSDWGPLPVEINNSTENSEVFSLHLNAKNCSILDVFTTNELIKIASDYGGIKIDPEAIESSTLVTNVDQCWFFYDPYRWRRWFNGLSLSDGDDDESNDSQYEFPILGSIKDEYNVRGCAAVCRTVASVESLTDGTEHDSSWSGAAKPFGTLKGEDGQPVPATALKNLVLPCMTDARLVSVDAVGGKNLATSDIDWITHIRYHLPQYMQTGPDSASKCNYCRQLVKWERQSFHKMGKAWLKYHAGECVQTVTCTCGGKGTCGCCCGGNWGKHGSGGTSHGH